MRDYIEIGSSPASESCAQVGGDNYYERAQKECRAFINQLWRFLSETKEINPANQPEKFKLRVKSNPHDFGTYYEVAAYFDDEDDKSMDLAFYLEGNAPTSWDKEARAELGLI